MSIIALKLYPGHNEKSLTFCSSKNIYSGPQIYGTKNNVCRRAFSRGSARFFPAFPPMESGKAPPADPRRFFRLCFSHPRLFYHPLAGHCKNWSGTTTLLVARIFETLRVTPKWRDFAWETHLPKIPPVSKLNTLRSCACELIIYFKFWQ